LSVKPDIEIDFTNMPFKSESFKLVVFDPPHVDNLGVNSWMAKKYGRLLPTWQDDIKKGFSECMRVLEVGGTLIFKWNETRIPIKKIIDIIGTTPLFGHTSGRQSKTIWMAFMKMTNEQNDERSVATDDAT
jgi:hypothetical protein